MNFPTSSLVEVVGVAAVGVEVAAPSVLAQVLAWAQRACASLSFSVRLSSWRPFSLAQLSSSWSFSWQLFSSAPQGVLVRLDPAIASQVVRSSDPPSVSWITRQSFAGADLSWGKHSNRHAERIAGFGFIEGCTSSQLATNNLDEPKFEKSIAHNLRVFNTLGDFFDKPGRARDCEPYQLQVGRAVCSTRYRFQRVLAHTSLTYHSNQKVNITILFLCLFSRRKRNGQTKIVCPCFFRLPGSIL
jgi:hypothetical protein